MCKKSVMPFSDLTLSRISILSPQKWMCVKLDEFFWKNFWYFFKNRGVYCMRFCGQIYCGIGRLWYIRRWMLLAGERAAAVFDPFHNCFLILSGYPARLGNFCLIGIPSQSKHCQKTKRLETINPLPLPSRIPGRQSLPSQKT